MPIELGILIKFILNQVFGVKDSRLKERISMFIVGSPKLMIKNVFTRLILTASLVKVTGILIIVQVGINPFLI